MSQSRGKRRRVFAFVAVGMLLSISALSLELVARAYWHLSKNVPFFEMGKLWVAFHPEVEQSGLLTADFSNATSTFDVLLLGGSVLTEEFGDIAEELKVTLATRLGQEIRVFNLAASARTSRDSLLKYQRVGDRPFDLVLVYDSINDVRMNNCPAESFRLDYAHCAWYRQLHMTREHRELATVVLPYTLHFLMIEAQMKLGWFIPRHRPDDRYLTAGAGTASAASLKGNLEQLLCSSRERNQTVVLSTFAIHVPPDYSLAKFQEKCLDYAEHRSPIEIWGTPSRVSECVAAHDEVIKELAAKYDHVVFVDQAKQIPGDRRHFDDICHLTDAGCATFVRNVVQALTDHPDFRERLVRADLSRAEPALLKEPPQNPVMEIPVPRVFGMPPTTLTYATTSRFKLASCAEATNPPSNQSELRLGLDRGVINR